MEASKEVMAWWHTIELPDGSVTPGRLDYRGAAGKRFLLPDDLTGKSVLDFGTWDGFWAIEAKKRGAEEVWATDRWSPMLETAKLALDAYSIPYICSGDLDYPANLAAEIGIFDVVLFYGILYHLKNPIMGLWNAAQCCKPGGTVIVESAVNQGSMQPFKDDLPMLWVIDQVHHGDPTNYFMPNTRGLLQLCRMAGLNPESAHDGGDNLRNTVVCVKV